MKAAKADQNELGELEFTTNMDLYKRKLIQIAAVCIAAIEEFEIKTEK